LHFKRLEPIEQLERFERAAFPINRTKNGSNSGIDSMM
jgi:hypothetical protein